jgi:hypothetical protein
MFAWNCSESAGKLLINCYIVDPDACFVGVACEIHARRRSYEILDVVNLGQPGQVLQATENRQAVDYGFFELRVFVEVRERLQYGGTALQLLSQASAVSPAAVD